MPAILPGGDSHIKVRGLLIGKITLNPKGGPMSVRLKLRLTSKGDHSNRHHSLFGNIFMHSSKRYPNGQIQ